VNANSTRRVVVEPGGEGVAPHVGLHALGCFADRIRLGDSLSACIPVRGERLALHDRGKVLVHTALMLAGGGESCADIEHLRAQEDLFGCVPSDSTVFRTFHEITAAVRDNLVVGMAKVRAGVWSRLGLSAGTDTVFLDIDASLVDVHSENKAGTGPTYKGGFGFHPLLCFADATGEALSGMLRPGNAGSNTVADHVVVADAALAQLPEAIRAGHHEGDDPELVGRQVVVRTDAAGTTKDLLSALRARNVGFFTSAATNAQVQGAIFDVEGIEELWAPARCQNGELRQGAAVCELTELVALDGFPDRTRLIVRREPLHPGAQRSLFPSTEYRYWGFLHRPGRQSGRPRRHHASPRPRGEPHRPPEGLGTSALPVPRPLRQCELDGRRPARRRPRALVSAHLSRGLLEAGPAQGPSLGLLPRARSPRAPWPTGDRAHPGRLAARRRHTQRPPHHRVDHLSDLAFFQSAPGGRCTSRCTPLVKHDPVSARNGGVEFSLSRQSARNPSTTLNQWTAGDLPISRD
jgi:hypothetical protein